MMNRLRYSRFLLLAFAAALFAGLVMGIGISRLVSQAEYTQTARLTGTSYSRHPELEQTLVQGLHDGNAADLQTGTELLHRYGYTLHTFNNMNRLLIIAGSVGLWMLLFLLFAAVQYRLQIKRKERIAGLTAYLYSINQGQHHILPRTGEDEYSFLEDELYKTVVELRHTRETAVLERQSLADNLSDIAHQIKTPLTSVSLMAELLADSRQNSADALYVEKIQSQLTRLERLVSSLLTLSRLDAGTLELQQLPVDVYTMLASAAEPLENILSGRRQTLTLQSSPAISYRGDYHWSSEALLNVLMNCSEHIPTGGNITVSYAQNPVYTQIIVEDSGAGFPAEELPHIFKRFYRGSNARKDSVGIGLALAHSIIQRQNGSIHAENRPEGGARFVIKWYAY
ncbi:HAMP domain-containing sensor histidine kinase [Paenibacillus sp. FSL L8-0436]|uniref:sensor histidine kinase n=1 Tax=Paenibacillus sp. FSL L8-0436 TaxID=2954686 RepID=UPI0031585836